jgi:histidinol phosphatase-like enzyme (inositol monophosphatase family)
MSETADATDEGATTPHPSVAAIATLVAGIADAVSPISLNYFRQPIDIEHKSDDSPVTIADREIELAIRQLIAHHYPDHAILGEEHGGDPVTEGPLWIIDPIDGTKSFVSGIPLYGTLIAYAMDGAPIVGTIDVPALRERWVGVEGRQTTFNDGPCRTSGRTDLAQARVATTSIDMFVGADRERFDALAAAARHRQFGGDCYLYGTLASGGIDVVVEAMLQPYDLAAVVPVVTGAGGVMTDWRGEPLTVLSDGWVVAAATPELHAQAIARLSS